MSLPTVRLGDVIELAYGRPLADSDRSEVGSVPVFGANGVKAYTEGFLYEYPTVIVGRKGSVGELHYCDGPSWALDVAYYVIHDDARIDLRFLYWQLKTLDLSSFAKGIKPGLNRNEVYNLEIALPSKLQQRRIVALLDEATQHIADLESGFAQTVSKLDELITSVRRSLLAKVGGNERCSLAELCDAGIVTLGRGKVISKQDLAATPGEYPVYSSAKENDGRFGAYGKYMFDEEMITWSIDGGGRLFYRPRHRFSVTNVGGTLRVLRKDVLDTRYLHQALLDMHSRVVFDWVAKAHPSVIRKVYSDIPVPNLIEQRRIVDLLDGVIERAEGVLATTRHRIGLAQDLRQSVLEAAFQGEL